jgi:hypothetical protein
VFCAEAAVELLIGHGSWLLRDDFVGGFVEFFGGVDDQEMAVVDWPGAIRALDGGDLPCSSSEEQMLRLAASITEGVPVDLRDAVCGLDATNAALAARALLHAAGHGRTHPGIDRGLR